MDDWNIPKIPQDTLYVPETIKDKHNFDYIIIIVENNIPLGQDIGEEFHLLSKNSIVNIVVSTNIYTSFVYKYPSSP